SQQHSHLKFSNLPQNSALYSHECSGRVATASSSSSFQLATEFRSQLSRVQWTSRNTILILNFPTCHRIPLSTLTSPVDESQQHPHLQLSNLPQNSAPNSHECSGRVATASSC